MTLTKYADKRIAELEAENGAFEKGARCDRDEIEALKAELLTAKNAYSRLHEIHHNTNVEWTKDIVRAREAEASLTEIEDAFVKERNQYPKMSIGWCSWRNALKVMGSICAVHSNDPSKDLARLRVQGEPDCDNCPQPHDEYNEPDCDACDAAWAKGKP